MMNRQLAKQHRINRENAMATYYVVKESNSVHEQDVIVSDWNDQVYAETKASSMRNNRSGDDYYVTQSPTKEMLDAYNQ